MKIKQPKGFGGECRSPSDTGSQVRAASPRFESTKWLQGIGTEDKTAVWVLTHPNPLEYMDVIEACANGEPLSRTDAMVIVTIMESPEFLKPKLNDEQLKIYDKAYERYCAEATFIMMKK